MNIFGDGVGSSSPQRRTSSNATQSPSHAMTNTNSSVMPITQIRWKPVPRRSSVIPSFMQQQSTTTTYSSDQSTIDPHKLLLAVSANGTITQWNVSNGKKTFEIRTSIVANGEQLYCLDYSPNNGNHFVTAGKHRCLYVYDEESNKLISTLGHNFEGKVGEETTSSEGHTNRIFAVKYVDENVILSGGWDSTVHIWDCRTGKSERNIFGPYICGESLDVSDDGNRILTGSWKGASDDPIEIWDFKTCAKIESVPWECNSSQQLQLPSPNKSRQVVASPLAQSLVISPTVNNSAHSDVIARTFIYTCQYGRVTLLNGSKSIELIAAGGSGQNDVRVFSKDNNESSSWEVLGSIADFPKPCLSLHFSNGPTMPITTTHMPLSSIAIGCSDGFANVVDLI